jgi:hypothetical protein
MVKSKKELEELEKIEKEIRESEIKESLNMVENRNNFNLGLILGLLFALVAGFFSIISHEIFIKDLSLLGKSSILLITGVLLVFFLFIGLRENNRNKILRKKISSYMKK